MLILEVILDLKSKQGYLAVAFLHVDIPEGDNIYVPVPRGFRRKRKVLKLQNKFYGLRHSSRALWMYLLENM